MSEITQEQDAIEGLFRFAQGFPTPDTAEQGTRLIGSVAAMRAYERGILYVEIEDATLGVETAFSGDGILPVVSDYVTHILTPAIEWRFKSGLETQLVNQYISAMDPDQPWRIQDLAEAVRDQVNRPALVNVASEGGIMDVTTQLRDAPGIPVSVSLLMMDMAIENMQVLSMQYQQQLMGDALMDTLDITPTVNALADMEAHPRAEMPNDVRQRALARLTTAAGSKPQQSQDR